MFFACSQTMNVLEIGCWSVVSFNALVPTCCPISHDSKTQNCQCSAETLQYKLTISLWNIMTYESYEILFDYCVSVNRMQPFCIHDCVGLRLRSQGSRFPRGFPDALLSILREEAWATPPLRFKPELLSWWTSTQVQAFQCCSSVAIKHLPTLTLEPSMFPSSSKSSHHSRALPVICRSHPIKSDDQQTQIYIQSLCVLFTVRNNGGNMTAFPDSMFTWLYLVRAIES